MLQGKEETVTQFYFELKKAYNGAGLDNFEAYKERILTAMTSSQVSRKLIDADPLSYQELQTQALDAEQ